MAEQSNNTGTGGINIEGDLYGMDVGIPDDQGGSQGQWSGGNVKVDKTIKDISKPTKETFAKYMSKTTLGQAGSSTHKNVYPVGSGDGTKVEDFRLTTNEGIPSPVTETKNESKFASVGIGVPTVQPDILRKGFSPGESPDGNKLLQTAATPADPGGPYVKSSKGLSKPLEGFVSSVLSKNRFTPDTRYVLDPTDRTAPPPGIVMPKDLLPGVSYAEQQKKPEEYEFNRLANVGTLLQMAATGEYVVIGDQNPGDQNKINPNDPAVALSAYLPGLGQLGAGVPLPSEYLNVESILGNLAEDPVTSGQLTDFNTQFEGVINNSFEKFAGFSSIGIAALITALSAAIVTAFISIGTLVGSGNQGTPLNQQIYSGRRLGLGNSTGYPTTGYPEDLVSLIASAGSGSASEFFGIMRTKSRFSDAIQAGIDATFGLSAGATFFASAGYLIGICRSIVRSISLLVVQFIEFGKLIEGAVNSGGSGAIDAFAKALEIISTIKNSRFIKCFNVFAQLGDRQILVYKSVKGGDNTQSGVSTLDTTDPKKDSGKRISMVDAYPDVNSEGADFVSPFFYAKSRLYIDKERSTLKLAWATSRAPASYILPARTELLASTDGIGAPRLMLNDPLARTKEMKFSEGTDKFRISDAEVELMENKLEGEYVPFYIQDLRTNEIVSFHAFLTNLTDEYTANYDSVDGIGRMDPVKIYKNTVRRVGVAFVLAALDDQDFDSMWQKINKLTTLIYPQYTRGKILSTANGDYVFEKPFTQMVGASPMVRLRVGNLFTSNYSKFNMAGIFGLNQPEAKLNKTSLTVSQSQTISDEVKYAVGNKFLLRPRTYTSYIGGSELDTSRYGKVFAGEIIQEFTTNGAAYLLIKISKIKEGQFPAQDFATIQESQKLYDSDLASSPGFTQGLAGSAVVPDIDANIFLATKEDLGERDAETEKKISDKNTQQYQTELKAFLDEQNNAITRSFKSAGGRGLAGFIENLSFDWNSATWDTQLGRKAPKMCRITFGFAPVHDISPGIDANGYNRAPIYRLGPFARRNL